VFNRYDPALNVSSRGPASSQAINAITGRLEGGINAPNRDKELPVPGGGHGGHMPRFSREAGMMQDTAQGIARRQVQDRVQNANTVGKAFRGYSINGPVNPQSEANAVVEGVYNDVSTPSNRRGAETGAGDPILTLTQAHERINRRRYGDDPDVSTDGLRRSAGGPTSTGPSTPRTASDGYEIPDTPLYANVTPEMSVQERREAVRARFLELWSGG